MAALLLLTAPAAAADVVFDPADAEELAAELAEATEVQGVCYGWRVSIDDAAGLETGVSTGSSFGAGVSLQDPPARSCATLVEFVATITYTSASSEASDSADFEVVSMPAGPTTDDLADLDLFDTGDLAGNEVDAAVARAVTALPRLATEAGVAPPVVAEPQTSAPPEAGTLSDDPGSDYLRRVGGLLAFGAVLLIGGVAFGVAAVVNARRVRAAPPPHPPHPPVDQTSERTPPPC